MHPELEKLIDYAVADGVITEKEKEILYRKAIELNADVAEFEMVLHAKLYNKQQDLKTINLTSSVEKLGRIKKCPSCGEVVNPLDIKCSSCGFELNITTSNQTLNEFLSKLMELGENKKENISKKTDLISHFPIPNNKEDLFEFLTISIPQVEQNISDLNSFEKKIHAAWLLKSKQLLIKGYTLFREDKEFIKKLNELDKKIEKKLKIINNRRIIVLISKIGLILFIILCVFIFWVKVINKKTKWELFVESVNLKYGKDFLKYKETSEYKGFLKNLEEEYKLGSIDTIDTDWRLLMNANIGISDLKFYMMAAAQLEKRNDALSTRYIDTAMAINPRFAFSYYLKGRLFPTSLPDSSIFYYNKAIELRQDIWKFYYFRHTAHVEKKQYSDAIRDIDSALKINPNDVMLLFMRINSKAGIDPYGTGFCNELKQLMKHKDYKLLYTVHESAIRQLDKLCNKN